MRDVPVFPLLRPLLATRGVGWITLIYLVASYALAAVLRGTVIGQIPWQYLGAFATGCLAAQIAYGSSTRWPNWKDRLPWGIIGLVMFLVFAVECAAFGWERVGKLQWAFDVPVFLAAAALLVGASREGTNHVRAILQTPLLAWIGVFSYSLYMVHYQLADVLEQYVLSHVTANQMVREGIIVTAFVPLLVLCAYLFYVICERPFHLIARRIGR